MNRKNPSRETVLAVLRDKAPRALHVGEIAAKLGTRSDERDEVVATLEALMVEGFAQEMPGGRYRYDKRALEKGGRVAQERGRQATGNEILGKLTMNARGFGFVSTEDDGGDVFIAPPNLGGAMHGDHVRIQAQKSAKGREGFVMGIVERGRQRIVGVLHEEPYGAVVVPEDERLGGPMIVVDKLPPTAKAGLMVVADIVRFGRDRDEPSEVRVVQALGRPGVASVEIQSIKIREGIVEEFSDDVVREAEGIPQEVPEADKEGREDLRHIPLMAIDPEDARDHDDAIWAERKDDGTYRIIVAIADVAHYVREGTAIDGEALARGCSVYLPDRAIPMLPHQLSSNLASLVPNVDRLTMAIEVELAKSGAIRSFRYIEGVMKSVATLAYGSVALALGLTQEGTRNPEADARVEQLRVLLEVSDILREKRMRRGSLDFELPEARVKLDRETDEPIDVYRSRVDPGLRRAYQIIEDFMLLANEVVAADFAKRQLPTIYRVHDAPDPVKLERFAGLAEVLGYPLPPGAEENPLQLSRFLERTKESPHANVLSFLMLRSMQQATYDTKNIGHFGLAATDYLHFTSPIRRYPDLAVHRVLKAVMHGDAEPSGLVPKLQKWAKESSRLERRAMDAEREAVDLYRALLMKKHTGEEFDATISSVTARGLYCALDTPFVEVFVRSESLGPEGWELDEHGLRLVGPRSGVAFSMGDKIRVRIESVSISKREVLGQPISHEPVFADLPFTRRAPVSRTLGRSAPAPRTSAERGAPAGRFGAKGRDGGAPKRGGAFKKSGVAPKFAPDSKRGGVPGKPKGAFSPFGKGRPARDVTPLRESDTFDFERDVAFDRDKPSTSDRPPARPARPTSRKERVASLAGARKERPKLAVSGRSAGERRDEVYDQRDGNPAHKTKTTQHRKGKRK